MLSAQQLEIANRQSEASLFLPETRERREYPHSCIDYLFDYIGMFKLRLDGLATVMRIEVETRLYELAPA